MNSETAKRLFKYIDGNLFWKERPEDDFATNKSFKIINTRNTGKRAGMKNTIGYWTVGFNNKTYLIHRIVWMIHNGDIDKNILIDHIDMNLDNNKIQNLRKSTKSTNGMNREKPKNNKTGIKGVSWYESRKKWVAQVKCGEIYKVKHFKEKTEAEKWVILQRGVLHKEFARN